MRNMFSCLIIVWLLQTVNCIADTGDVLISDLQNTSRNSALRTRTIQSTGCAPWGTGVCVKMECTTGNCSGSDSWTLDIPDNSREVTIVWSERFDVWPLTWSYGGCKSIRPFHGGGTSDYIGTLISFHSDHGYQNGFYSSQWESSNVIFSPYVTGYNDNLCTGSPLRCTRLGFSWTTDGGVTKGMGTNWRKMREWIKMPSTFSSSDGEIKLWVDDLLIYHNYNINMNDTGVNPPAITGVMFAPVDETATPHGHWYDEITIYEGYVPPDGNGSAIQSPSLSQPTYVK